MEDIDDLWREFEQDGALSGTEKGPSPPGSTWNGALSATRTLNPGELWTLTFIIAWFFPNRYVSGNQSGLGVGDSSDQKIENMYSNWFSGALDVASYGARNYRRLVSETERFVQTFYSSSVPEPVLASVSSNMATIRTPTCFWTKDGMFYGFEGCCGESTSHYKMSGCCPLNCTHVWNYEQTLARLFPSLERSMRAVDFNYQLGRDGRIPHREVLPLHLDRWHDGNPRSHLYAADGQCGSILKFYREVRNGGGMELLRSMWEKVKLAMQYTINRWDPDRDGILDGPQWNTYDCYLHGYNTITTSLYPAALRAAETVATIMGDSPFAALCRRLYRKGRLKVEQSL